MIFLKKMILIAIKIDNNTQEKEFYCIWPETKDGRSCSANEKLIQIVFDALQNNKKIKRSKKIISIISCATSMLKKV